MLTYKNCHANSGVTDCGNSLGIHIFFTPPDKANFNYNEINQILLSGEFDVTITPSKAVVDRGEVDEDALYERTKDA